MTPARDAPAPVDRLGAWLRSQAVESALRPWLGAAVERVEAALPRPAGTERGPALVAELAPQPDDGRSVALLLDPGQALGTLERLLGGPGASSPARPLMPAECGLVGYGVAQLAAHAGFALRDVRFLTADALAERGRDALLWALTLRGAFGSLEARLLLGRGAAQSLVPFTVRAVLRDALAEGALTDLRPGEVLASEAFLLTDTSTGWAGAVELEVAGLVGRCAGRVERGRVMASSALGPARSDALTLVLAERAVDLAELAALVGGECAAFEHLRPGPVTLEHRGRPLAQGELVRHGGALGVRVQSMR